MSSWLSSAAKLFATLGVGLCRGIAFGSGSENGCEGIALRSSESPSVAALPAGAGSLPTAAALFLIGEEFLGEALTLGIGGLAESVGPCIATFFRFNSQGEIPTNNNNTAAAANKANIGLREPVSEV